MAIALNNILQITTVQSYLSQAMLNVFHYRVDVLTGTPTYNEVSSAFALAILDKMNAVQSSLVSNVRIVINNLSNGIDINEQANVATGDNTGDSLPSTVAHSYRLIRTNSTTRHGSKRIGGLPESGVTGNDIVAGALTAVNALATAMGTDILVDGAAGDCTLQPVIVGRIHIGNPGAGELDLSVINPVQAGQFIRLTTQTTRRAGRGI